MAGKSSFLDKVLGRIGRLDTEGLQTVVQRLARERTFLEMLFNTIEDGVLVVDAEGRIIYFNQAVTKLLGIQPNVEGQGIVEFIPELIGRAFRAWTSGAIPARCGTSLRCIIPERGFCVCMPRRWIGRAQAATRGLR
ncbi:MAG TPA: PAS domain-containing protein [Clostridia bacterium]|nr:PAS domain-containing protein [Clostridia bacterium]